MNSIDPGRLHPVALETVMRDVEPVLGRLCIDFYVVGAVARDIWLTHEGGNPARRMTSDVDLAISLSDETAYEQLLAELLETGRFHATRSSAFALIHTPTRTTLDLMPFGAIAGPDGTVRVAGASLETISTVGFAEMAASAVAVKVAGSDRTWRVASLPALLLLKLVAWEDRPEKRGKDATDIALILRHYFELAGDRLYDQHYDLLDDPEMDDLLYRYGIAAHLAGRELRTLLTDSPVLLRVQTFLRKQSAAGPVASFVRAMTQGDAQDAASAYRMFTRLVEGFEDERNAEAAV